ncbi:MAG: lipoprotein [Burkholderiaceae bacterium]|nr:lipoprotein [Burkholderiaceae bacterium]
MNRSLLTLGVAMVMVMSLSACSTMNQPQTPTQNNPPDMHTSQNALDWQGTYKGVMPCADCEGIATRLELSDDGTYALSTQYLGKDKKVFVENGSFTWNAQGSAIRLNGINPSTTPTQYQVGENQLFQLDLAGQRITGDLAPLYVLTKVMAMPVEDKKWQLVELQGQAVKGSAETHYLMLMSDKNQVSAKAGCNTMFGGYEIKQPLQLRFKQLASTMMACDNMADEAALAKVLGMVDNYTISGNTLSLNKARMAPLARFKLIEAK